MAVKVEMLDYPGSPWTALPPGVVRVWEASLDANDADLENCRTVLSADELARAARFLRDTDRDRYVTAHGMLRRILSREIAECRPESLAFLQGPNGKPCIASEGGVGLQFNLAHSEDRLLVATALNLEVGIDLEETRADVDIAALSSVCFTQSERMRVETVPPPEQPDAFFRCWVRKEACLKACGLGVTALLAHIDVLSADDIDIPGMPGWICHLFDLRTNPGYHAALGVMRRTR